MEQLCAPRRSSHNSSNCGDGDDDDDEKTQRSFKNKATGNSKHTHARTQSRKHNTYVCMYGNTCTQAACVCIAIPLPRTHHWAAAGESFRSSYRKIIEKLIEPQAYSGTHGFQFWHFCVCMCVCVCMFCGKLFIGARQTIFTLPKMGGQPKKCCQKSNEIKYLTKRKKKNQKQNEFIRVLSTVR